MFLRVTLSFSKTPQRNPTPLLAMLSTWGFWPLKTWRKLIDLNSLIRQKRMWCILEERLFQFLEIFLASLLTIRESPMALISSIPISLASSKPLIKVIHYAPSFVSLPMPQAYSFCLFPLESKITSPAPASPRLHFEAPLKNKEMLPIFVHQFWNSSLLILICQFESLGFFVGFN